MSSSTIAALEAPCRALFARLGPAWTWDGRSSTVVLAFPKAQSDSILGAVASALSGTWTPDTLKTAPAHVQHMADAFGGLRSGQRLLAAEVPGEGAALFGALWPWGDGETLSLRLGYFAPDLPDAARDSSDAQLKSWFSVR